MLPILPWMGILIFSTSCALLFPDRTAPKSKDYDVTPPSAPWHKLEVGSDPNSVDAMKADHAYENPETGAIISVNSICRKYSGNSLETLTDSLVRGIADRELVERKEREMAGTKAMESLYTGSVDKVPLRIRTVVLTKNDCTFDFVYVAIPKRDVDQGAAFDSFLLSFRTE